MTTPYSSLPATSWWRRSVSTVSEPEIDPVVGVPFMIAENDLVATAGSCFAQHIARYLRTSGFKYFLAESMDRTVPANLAADYGYGVFSCRYGNVYTTRQLLQLFERAFDRFKPSERPWTKDERWYDPLRPFIQPQGFVSELELVRDRESHLRAVKRMFETTDVFVFTLGLTECWECIDDGAILPSCPGASGIGVFDAARYRFRNFTAGEVTEDLSVFCQKLREINPNVRIILTVSPVPLIATMESRSVIVSTAYSKAALRVAADEVSRAFSNTAYFPSYEIVTSPFSQGRHYASDWREVTEGGVKQVMGLFLRHFCGLEIASSNENNDNAVSPATTVSISQAVAEAVCDEVRLEF